MSKFADLFNEILTESKPDICVKSVEKKKKLGGSPLDHEKEPKDAKKLSPNIKQDTTEKKHEHDEGLLDFGKKPAKAATMAPDICVKSVEKQQNDDTGLVDCGKKPTKASKMNPSIDDVAVEKEKIEKSKFIKKMRAKMATKKPFIKKKLNEEKELLNEEEQAIREADFSNSECEIYKIEDLDELLQLVRDLDVQKAKWVDTININPGTSNLLLIDTGDTDYLHNKEIAKKTIGRQFFIVREKYHDNKTVVYDPYGHTLSLDRILDMFQISKKEIQDLF